MFIVTAKQCKITSTRLLLLLLRESQCYNPVQTQVTALGGLQTPHTASMEFIHNPAWKNKHTTLSTFLIISLHKKLNLPLINMKYMKQLLEYFLCVHVIFFFTK